MAVNDMRNDELVDHYYELKHLPADDEKTAKFYEDIIREMASRFAIKVENESLDCIDPGYTQVLIKNNGEMLEVSTKWDITIHCDSEEEQKHVMELLDKIDEQQIPKNDEVVIKIPKDTLKYSNKDFVVYNQDWIRKHFREEVEIMTGEKL